MDIDGEAAGDVSGIVSMNSNGNIIAISAPNNDGNGSNSGHARFYSWNGSSWTQRGSDINGEAAGDLFGESIAINDTGDVVIIGASNNSGVNGASSGHARVWLWNGIRWIQRGSDLDGSSAGDGFGDSSAISGDGNTVAAGSMSHDGGGNTDTGQIKVYSWSNGWVQKGASIVGGNGNKIGGNLSMSGDGNTLAAGGEGIAKVYFYNGTNWQQKGTDLTRAGQSNEIHKVSLSNDSNILSISASNNQVKIYTWRFWIIYFNVIC